MIIRRPTGAYANIIPQSPDEAGSVVYTISSVAPPRSALDFAQIPAGITRRVRPSRVVAPKLRRTNLGALALTSKDNKPSRVSGGNRAFYVGQVGDFALEDPSEWVQQILSTAIETVHDTHYVDAIGVGLDEAQAEALAEGAGDAQRTILARLEQLQKHKDDIEVDLATQQRILNETMRLLQGVTTILEVDPDKEGLVEMQQQLEAQAELTRQTIKHLVEERNGIPAQVRAEHDRLRALAALVD